MRLLFGILLLPFSILSIQQANQLPANDLGASVRSIFIEHRCHACHCTNCEHPGANNQALRALNPDQEDQASFGDILSFDNLKSARLVPQSPVTQQVAENAELYRRLRSMPPRSTNIARLNANERALVLSWIQAGAPNPGEAPSNQNFQFISDQDMLTTIATDLQRLSPNERRFARYFTFTHLYNGRNVREFQVATQALMKLVNCLSWSPRITRPVAIDSNQTIFRINLRHYLWHTNNVTVDGRNFSDKWDLIQAKNPYAIARTSSVFRTLTTLSGNALPFMRGDWFVNAASKTPLYEQILELPNTESGLERKLANGTFVEDNITNNRVARSGFLGRERISPTTKDRIIERHVLDSTLNRIYWRSYDFATLQGRANIFNFPLEFDVGTEENGVSGGGEVIFSLPNRLHAYAIFNKDGEFVTEAPTQVVSDHTRVAGTEVVINGVSCMGCHYGGMIDREDQLREHVENVANPFSRTVRRRIAALHPRAAQFSGLINSDVNTYQAALRETGIPIGPNEPIKISTRFFRGPINLTMAAAELGLTVQQFRNRLTGNPLAREFPLLGNRATVSRIDFQRAVPRFVEVLQLGNYIGLPQNTPTQVAQNPPSPTPPTPPVSPPVSQAPEPEVPAVSQTVLPFYRRGSVSYSDDTIEPPCRRSGAATKGDVHTVSLIQGRRFRVVLHSVEFNEHLCVLQVPSSGNPILVARASGGRGTNAELEFTTTQSGTYQLIVTSIGSTGRRLGQYRLDLEQTGGSVTETSMPFTRSGTITAQDTMTGGMDSNPCVSGSPRGSFMVDTYNVILIQGSRYRTRLTGASSPRRRPLFYLCVYQINGFSNHRLVGSSREGRNVEFTASRSGTYRIRVKTSSWQRLGSGLGYTLRMDSMPASAN